MKARLPGASKGFALILVAGVLGVMTVLAICFLTLAQMERRASQQRLHTTKALLLARSGVEDALARLEMNQDPDADASRYGGEGWNAPDAPDGARPAGRSRRPSAMARGAWMRSPAPCLSRFAPPSACGRRMPHRP